MFMCVLKGGVFFATDLLRAMNYTAEIDFIRAKSYEGTQSTGDVIFHVLPETDLEGRHVILLEDILDTGRTCTVIKEWCQDHGTASVTLCTLLDKPARRIIPIEAEYVGFTIEDHFVVGYGLDYDEKYRALPEVFVLEEE